jgi:hypothetical protein
MAAALPPSYYAFDEIAGATLAQAAEFVPASIPLTTVLIGRPTARGLRGLVLTERYDAIVATESLLSHCPRLGRDLERLEVLIVPVRMSEPVRADHLDVVGVMP